MPLVQGNMTLVQRNVKRDTFSGTHDNCLGKCSTFLMKRDNCSGTLVQGNVTAVQGNVIIVQGNVTLVQGNVTIVQ